MRLYPPSARAATANRGGRSDFVVAAFFHSLAIAIHPTRSPARRAGDAIDRADAVSASCELIRARSGNLSPENGAVVSDQATSICKGISAGLRSRRVGKPISSVCPYLRCDFCLKCDEVEPLGTPRERLTGHWLAFRDGRFLRTFLLRIQPMNSSERRLMGCSFTWPAAGAAASITVAQPSRDAHLHELPLPYGHFPFGDLDQTDAEMA
jgi:hypothetical protein